MLEYTTSDGKKIYVFEKLLSEDICSQWISLINETNMIISQNDTLANKIFDTLKTLIGEYPMAVTGCRSEVTMAKRGVPIQAHYDDIFGNERWKVVCYLNDVEGGGTDFQSGNDWISISPGRGNVIIFDMRIFHRGSVQQENKAKYTIGIRLLE